MKLLSQKKTNPKPFQPHGLYRQTMQDPLAPHESEKQMPKASLEEGASCLAVCRLGASCLDVIGCGLCASENRDVDVKS